MGGRTAQFGGRFQKMGWGCHMAGWLLVWAQGGIAVDPDCWKRSAQAAVRYGGVFTGARQDRVALGAWRRGSGEFPVSGTIASLAGAQVAWTGQCLGDTGDTGDASAQAMSVLAANPFDDAVVARLNGPFSAAVIRAEPFEVRVVTDRHRHYPVYVHHGPHLSVASTEMRCVVPWLERTELSRDAVDMLLRCGELIDRQTLLHGVEMLPPGTVLSDTGQRRTERRYWSMRSDGSGTPAVTAEQLGQALKVGVRKMEAASPALGITLSGGLDSRIILDLCENPQRVPSFTWGLPNCRDIVCASEFATLVGSEHVVKHWTPEAFPPLWSRGVDLTGGNCGVDSMFMLPFVPLVSSACGVVLNGLAGDATLGGNWLKRSWLAEQKSENLGSAVWRWRVPADQDQLVDRLMTRVPGASSASDRWVASIGQREGARPIERLNDWFIENRVFRTTNCGTMILRGGVESHSPFFDRDFIDTLTRVNQDQKFKHRLYLDVMNFVAPRAASVKWQRTNVKPSRGYHANLAAMVFQRLITKACAPVGITPFRDLQVADLAGWFRGPWREEVEKVIQSNSFRQRAIVNSDVVDELWQAHLGGADHGRQISVLIAIELFARLTVDGMVA